MNTLSLEEENRKRHQSLETHRSLLEDGKECPLCGSGQIRVDEVSWGGRLRLSQCGRCENRWTERAKKPSVARELFFVNREVANAA